MKIFFLRVFEKNIRIKKKLYLCKKNYLYLVLIKYLYIMNVAFLDFRKIIAKIVKPHSKSNFLRKINSSGKLLDVGCGNDSSYNAKKKCPNIHYTGIDIVDYNQQKTNLSDEYIITTPEKFADTIANMSMRYDAVVSSHNLEHCNDRENTLIAMVKVLKSGGYLYLSFPTENSVNFPSRKGTLNYYDDPTHKDAPPNFDKVMTFLKANNMEIIFASKSYKPFFLYIMGALLEWKSKKDKKVKSWNWAYWGFEVVIWAKKK